MLYSGYVHRKRNSPPSKEFWLGRDSRSLALHCWNTQIVAVPEWDRFCGQGSVEGLSWKRRCTINLVVFGVTSPMSTLNTNKTLDMGYIKSLISTNRKCSFSGYCDREITSNIPAANKNKSQLCWTQPELSQLCFTTWHVCVNNPCLKHIFQTGPYTMATYVNLHTNKLLPTRGHAGEKGFPTAGWTELSPDLSTGT